MERMNYSIGEFAKITGLSIHTLRYYEDSGLILPGRNFADQRQYSDADIAWVAFIKRLKATGMPIKSIARYAQLRGNGDSTLRERLEMLETHGEELAAQIEELIEHKQKLEEKIAWYKREIKKKKM